MANDPLNTPISNKSSDLEQSSHAIVQQARRRQSDMRQALSNQNWSNLSQRLESYYTSLRGWRLRHDFGLWEQAEMYLAGIWQDLRNTLRLAMEYGLYEEVKDIFLESRHLMQTTGFVKDRICIAAWLCAEATHRNDWAIKHLMTASLAWSYTSCGCHQNLKKANKLWQELKQFIVQVGDPSTQNEYRAYLRDRQDTYPYDELLITIYETGVRVALRYARFEEAKQYTYSGRIEISELSQSGFLSARLKERFDVAFCYHEGVASYLMGNPEQAQKTFEETVRRGEWIAWNRLVRGAKSWLATIAIEQEDYQICETILQEITDDSLSTIGKRDVICHLIQAKLSGKRGENGEKVKSEKKAAEALYIFSKQSGRVADTYYDLNSFRQQQPKPKLCLV
jgi:hypothetical protein